MAIYRIDNFLLCNSRRFTKFLFGSFFISCTINEIEGCFEIRLKKKIKIRDKQGNLRTESIDDYVDIEAFKKEWTKWKILFDTFEEA